MMNRHNACGPYLQSGVILCPKFQGKSVLGLECHRDLSLESQEEALLVSGAWPGGGEDTPTQVWRRCHLEPGELGGGPPWDQEGTSSWA